MKLRTIIGLVVAAALGAAGHAVARDLAERVVGTKVMSGGMMSGGMMGGGMMGGGMGGMMAGCRDMMEGGGMTSRQPNAQWQGGRREAPSPDAEKQR